MTTDIAEAKAADRDKAILELYRTGMSRRRIVAVLKSAGIQVGKSTVDHVIEVYELTQAVQPAGDGQQEIPLTWLYDNPHQCRELTEESIESMAESLALDGQLQPVKGRRVGPEHIELVYGHRRVAAMRRLAARSQWHSGARCEVVEDLADQNMALECLAENTQRKDLSEWELARAAQRALEHFPELTIAALAQRCGVERSTLSNNLRVLKLPQPILDRVRAGEVPFRVARELLCLQNDDHAHLNDMEWVLGTLRAKADWSVKRVRWLIRSRAVSSPGDWRALDPGDGDTDWQAVEHVSDPLFDVFDFVGAHVHAVHHLPRLDGEKSRRWTCAAKDWQRAQQAALAAQTPAQPTPVAPAAPDQQRPDPAAGLGVAAPVDVDLARPLTLPLTVGQAQDLLQLLCEVWTKALPESHTRVLTDGVLSALETELGAVGVREGAPERQTA